MRVVIAYDLSLDAERAVDLVAQASWPPGSVIRIATSPSGIGAALSSFATRAQSRAHMRHLRSSITAAHERIAARLAATGASIETAFLAGRPGRAVVREAEAVGADLIVAGARSQSPLEATVLGSVSSEISEQARCPVLIVRVESFERAVLATDGSPAAEAATALVGRLPLFATAEVRVVHVVPADDGVDDDPDDSGERAHALIATAVERLVAAGRHAHGQLRVGNPAHELAVAAREWPADVVVVGSSGKPMIRRLILGSVARSVLQGVPSSVLVVRPRSRVDGDAEQR